VKKVLAVSVLAVCVACGGGGGGGGQNTVTGPMVASVRGDYYGTSAFNAVQGSDCISKLLREIKGLFLEAEIEIVQDCAGPLSCARITLAPYMAPPYDGLDLLYNVAKPLYEGTVDAAGNFRVEVPDLPRSDGIVGPSFGTNDVCNDGLSYELVTDNEFISGSVVGDLLTARWVIEGRITTLGAHGEGPAITWEADFEGER
jgi:hypothetical protein